MKFQHQFVDIPPAERVEIDGKRYYKTTDGIFPSVTSVLGSKLDKSGLEQWKKRVGEEEANKVSIQATNRGREVHDLCEKYLLNDPNYRAGAMPVNLFTFNTIKPYLDSRIGKIFGIELYLWSKSLNSAGACDLFAEWDGIPSIIDFKTSKRAKRPDMIESYFLQTTAYSIMAQELTGIETPQIVVLIAVDDSETQVFAESRRRYIPRLAEVFCG